MKFGEIPACMYLTAMQIAGRSCVFIEKQVNKADLDDKRALLDCMYTNPNTGKKLTNAQVNTRFENLIDQVARSMGAQRAAKLIDQPGYKDMVLSKEGMGKMFDRQAENLRFLNQEVQLNKVKEQVRDTLDNQLSSKKTTLKQYRESVEWHEDFIKELKKYPEINEENIRKVFFSKDDFLSRTKELELRGKDIENIELGNGIKPEAM